MDHFENQLRDLLNEITVLYADTLNDDISQKNKIKNYKEGGAKIMAAIELLEKLKNGINEIDIQDQSYVQMDRMKEFIELLELPGFRFNEIMTTTKMLKKISNQLNTPGAIIDPIVEQHTMEKNNMIHHPASKQIVDLYEQ